MNLVSKARWSNAQPTTTRGIKFSSKVEALVYERLSELFGADRIRCQVTMPLLSGAPKENGRPLRMTVDFAIMEENRVKCWVDAKTTRKSREWLRGKSLFEATWGTIWEWDGRGEFPANVGGLT